MYEMLNYGLTKQIWGGRKGRFTLVISRDDDEYRASYKKNGGMTHYVGGVWKTYDDAYSALLQAVKR